MHVDKKALPLDQYQEYGIDQLYSAFIITLLNVTQSQMDQYEQDLMLKGYKLFHSQMQRVHENFFNAKVIIASAPIYSGLQN